VARDLRFHTDLLALITPQLDFLAPVIAEHYIRKPADDGYRYVYYNHMNLALKTSTSKRSVNIPREVTKMFTEIHSDFERSPEGVSEVIVKTANDGWVVGRRSDQRELFVFIDGRSVNLIEVTEEIRKLSAEKFGNIFIDWT